MSTDTSAPETRHTEDDQLVESSSEDFDHARTLDVDHDWF
jgi:maltose alpha-D-glucosyltransferase/alpha-amylase